MNQDESTQEEKEFKDLLIVSEELNNSRVLDKIAEALSLFINPDDDFFHELEEVILKNFKRMDEEIRQVRRNK